MVNTDTDTSLRGLQVARMSPSNIAVKREYAVATAQSIQLDIPAMSRGSSIAKYASNGLARVGVGPMVPHRYSLQHAHVTNLHYR